MNCPTCGAAAQEGDYFCIQCGTFLQPVPPSPPSTEASSAAAESEAAGASPEYDSPARRPDDSSFPALTPERPEPEPPESESLAPAPPVSESAAPEPPWSAPEPAPYPEPESSRTAPPEPERSPSVPAVHYDSSKGRWLALAAVLGCLFVLAAIGGYLLQQRGSQPVPDDSSGAGSAPNQTPDDFRAGTPKPTPGPGIPPPDAAPPSPAEPNGELEPPDEPPFGGGGEQLAGGGDGSSGNSSGVGLQGSGNPPAPPGNETDGSESKKSPVEPPVENKPVVSGGESLASGQDGPITPPPPSFESQSSSSTPETVAPETKKPPETTIVAGGGTFGGVPPGVPPGPPPVPKRPEPPPAVVEEGIIYWTGRLQKNDVIVIELGRASAGQAEGKLPGTPVDVWLPSPAVALTERPNPKNNWSRVAFRCLRNTPRNVTINVQWKRLR